MGFTAVSNTFSTGENVDANELNQNWTDIVNGTSDGTKNCKVKALTCANKLTISGTPVVGNAMTIGTTCSIAEGLTLNGALTVNSNLLVKILRTDEEAETISSGAVTPSESNVVLTGEGDIADELDTITATNFSDGDILLLKRAASKGYNITVKNGTGNIICGSDRTLGDNSLMFLIYDGVATKWHMLSFQAN